MKLSWKLFFITTPLIILFLTVFGTWMIQESFAGNLEKEIDRCVMENQMFLTSYELTVHGLSDEQRERTSMRKLVESFHRAVPAEEGGARVYGSGKEVLYQDNGLQVAHDIWNRLETSSGEEESYNTGQQIVREGTQYYIVVLGVCGGAGGWVETIRNVTSVFEDRAELYAAYRAGMLLVSLLAGALILFVLFVVTGNIRRLSGVTRRFALGRYDARVEIRGDDEIGRLAQDFNWMADVMNGQMEQLKHEVRRQEEFTAAFAHELKTPLTAVIGYADTLRSTELSPDENRLCADYIYRQGKRLQSLSYKLLNLAMADEGRLEYRSVSVPELFREAEQTAGESLKEKKLTLIADAEEGAVWGDRELLGSLLLNLIDNARKASPAGGRIWLSGQRLAQGYRILVADEGKGVSPEELSRISEAFYMVDKSRSRQEGGAGLGLALCKKILELHRGSWLMESEPGRGFRVTLLLGTSAEAHAGRRRLLRQEGRRQRKPDRRRSVNATAGYHKAP